MKKLVLYGSAVVLAASGVVRAADLPPAYKAPAPAPITNWTGVYVGLNAGYAWNHDGGPLECVNPLGVSFGVGCGLIPFSSLNASGAFGGAQIGYNWQAGQYVLGFETDFQGADIRGSTTTSGPWPFVGLPQLSSANSLFTASQKIDWFGTARLRLGYAFGQTLLYATGGLVYGRVALQTDVLHPANAFPASGTFTNAGWTAGGGIEYAFSNHVSAKIEGLYYDLGDNSISGGSVPMINGFTRGKDFETRGALVRGGVNYKFDWAAP
jgi:outer membrane immunogenic protein